jgi:hypothetical protein
LVGSTVTERLAHVIDLTWLLVIAAALLEFAVWCIAALGEPARAATREVRSDTGALRGGAWRGWRLIASSGYLANIALYTFLFGLLAERCGKTAARSRHLPERTDLPEPSFIEITRGAARPGDAEIAANPRARSARMRAAERTAAVPLTFDATALGLPAIVATDEGR